MLLHGVQPEELETLFPLAAPWIFRIPRLNEKFKLCDVYEAVKAEEWQLWLFMDKKVDGVILSTITQFPLSRELTILGLAGNGLKQGVELFAKIENYARINACDRVVMLGARKGFARMFPEYEASFNRVTLNRLTTGY